MEQLVILEHALTKGYEGDPSQIVKQLQSGGECGYDAQVAKASCYSRRYCILHGVCMYKVCKSTLPQVSIETSSNLLNGKIFYNVILDCLGKES